MFDFWILARLLGEGNFRPRVIIVEVNPLLGECPPSAHIHTQIYLFHFMNCLHHVHLFPCISGYPLKQKTPLFHRLNALPLTINHPATTSDTYWDATRYSGANPKAFYELGRRFGYEMVCLYLTAPTNNLMADCYVYIFLKFEVCSFCVIGLL
jgi:hypothetical protein